MDDSSPLAMQFKQFDADGDGKLNADETYELCKLLGKNVYKGSVASAVRKLNYNQQNQEQAQTISFTQFKEFFQSLDNPLKHDIWKGKYSILKFIKQGKCRNDDPNTAAPGAVKQQFQENPFKGDIQVTVGPTNQNYDSFIQVKVQKIPKAESKPFVKIIFEQNSNEGAKQLQTKFKNFQTNLFNIMKSSDPESAQILDFIHIITNVSQNKLNVFITISNELLIELGTLAAQFFDRILGTTIEAKVQFKHQFNVDIKKFIEKDSEYSFYHALTKNYHTRLTWNALNFRQSTKQLLKNLQFFQKFKYDKMDPSLIFMTILLHTQICEAKLVFDNAAVGNTQLESKQQILHQLTQLIQKIKSETDLGLLQTIASFNNRAYIQASIGDWKAQASIHIKDANQLFSQKLLEYSESNNQNQQNTNDVQAQYDNAEIKLQINKQLTPKKSPKIEQLSQKSSSIDSIKIAKVKVAQKSSQKSNRKSSTKKRRSLSRKSTDKKVQKTTPQKVSPGLKDLKKKQDNSDSDA